MANFDSRLDVRLHNHSKKLIEQAAQLLGLKPSDYARITLERDAKSVIDDLYNIKLTERDWMRFLQILDEEAPPNEALKNAASEYQNDVKNGRILE